MWGLQGQVQFLGLRGLKLLNSEQLAPLSLTPVGLTTLPSLTDLGISRMWTSRMQMKTRLAQAK